MTVVFTGGTRAILRKANVCSAKRNISAVFDRFNGCTFVSNDIKKTYYAANLFV